MNCCISFAINPAARPAIIAPTKPELLSIVIYPPTNPAMKASSPASPAAMNPANTGSMKLNVTPPRSFSAAASGVIEPNCARASTDREERSTDAASNRKARAIRIPPPATNGAIQCTPERILGISFIRMISENFFRTCSGLMVSSVSFNWSVPESGMLSGRRTDSVFLLSEGIADSLTETVSDIMPF